MDRYEIDFPIIKQSIDNCRKSNNLALRNLRSMIRFVQNNHNKQFYIVMKHHKRNFSNGLIFYDQEGLKQEFKSMSLVSCILNKKIFENVDNIFWEELFKYIEHSKNSKKINVLEGIKIKLNGLKNLYIINPYEYAFLRTNGEILKEKTNGNGILGFFKKLIFNYLI